MSWGLANSAGINGERDAWTPGRACSLLILGAAVLFATPAGAQTHAGTAVVNVADATYRIGGSEGSARSNRVAITVAERLDVALTDGGTVIAAGARIVTVRIGNRGNGDEAFTVATSAGGGTVPVLLVDRDGNGRFDAAIDTPLEGGRTPSLVPGGSVTLFVRMDANADGPLVVRTAAATGSGTPGTVFAGMGDGGGDAVVGPTGADAVLTIGSATDAVPTLVKVQSVHALDGSGDPVRGAIVTYTMTATFAGPVDAATLADPIPAATAYVAGSLSLDDIPLSDAADDDPGTVAGGAVRVSIGRVATAAIHRVRFQVQLQ